MSIVFGLCGHVRRAIFIEHSMPFDIQIRWIGIMKFYLGIINILSISVNNFEVVDAFLFEIRPIHQKSGDDM